MLGRFLCLIGRHDLRITSNVCQDVFGNRYRCGIYCRRPHCTEWTFGPRLLHGEPQ